MRGDDERVRAALDRLVDQGVLSPGQREPVARAVQEAMATPTDRRAVRWAEILSYAGGALVVAGGAVLVGASWDALRQGARVGLLGLITLLLLAVAVWTAGGPHALVRRRGSSGAAVRLRVAGVLWALAAGTAAIGASQFHDHHEVLTGAAVGLVVSVAGYVRLPGSVGLLTVGVFSAVTVAALLDLIKVRSEALSGVALIAVGAVFAALAVTRVLSHRVLALGIGSALALVGAQWPLLSSGRIAWSYVLTLIVALGCLALYARENTWVLILAGIIGITLAVPQAIWDLTDGALGGGLMTVLTGCVLLVAGAIGLAWHRRALR